MHSPYRQADNHSAERRGKPFDRRDPWEHAPIDWRESKKKGVRAAGEQRVLQELRVRTQHAQPDDQSERPPAPVFPLANSTMKDPQRERKESAHEQLAVMSRRDVGSDLSAHHVGDATDERSEKAVAEDAKKTEGEESGEENVDDEAPRHCQVGRQNHPKKERRIEDVAVHRRDVRHPAKQVRIP